MKHEAISALRVLNLDETSLRAQWAAQIEEQTKPVPRKIHY
jgi:hypothetical protein